MLSTKTDEFGRQICPYDNALLELHGAWSYNGRIHTNKYAFRCTKCWNSFVGDAKETEQHQDGLEAAQMQKKVDNIKSKITTCQN